ncbi:MAG: peptide-methionine (R)-S-oxide reductase MsrB [Rhodobacteraceae bacterium]|nr:peptide-methionine (R)-S-oxide reductase MsrB [Paracoccaceae bacterium]
MQTRRNFLLSASALTAFAASGQRALAAFEITRSEEEWKAILTPAQFAILREDETEKPFSNSLLGEKSDLLKEARVGNYHCAGCDLAVYPSDTKFDSGTGWPSFWAPIEGAIGTRKDNTLFTTRTETHCRRCGGHLGHIFEDGPAPTGKRHCLNGLAMTFRPA